MHTPPVNPPKSGLGEPLSSGEGRAWARRGGVSRNKVAVGEPAARSPPNGAQDWVGRWYTDQPRPCGQTPVDPAGGHCYPGPTKPCESRAVRLPGGRLSNTWATYPRVGDNPGKLGLIPDRPGNLEWSLVESSGARGWACGRLGSWWGNGPPSRRSVRAMRVGARRWTLRQGSRPYGAQQARNLRNARKRDGGTRSALA